MRKFPAVIMSLLLCTPLIAQKTETDSNIKKLTESIKAKDSDLIFSYGLLIEDGNFGENDYDIIQLRKDFQELITEAEKFINETPKAYLVYEDELSVADINFETETYIYSFKAAYVRDLQKLRLTDSIKNAYTESKKLYDLGIDSLVEKLKDDINITEDFSICGKDSVIKNSVTGAITLPKESYALQKNINIPIKAHSKEKNLSIVPGKMLSVPAIKKEDYFEIFKQNIKLKEYISDVYAITFPQSVKESEVLSLIEFFSYPKIDETINILYAEKIQGLEQIVCSNKELTVLENTVFPTRSKALVLAKEKFIVTNKSTNFPRLKSVFRQNAGKFLPLSFKKFQGNTYYLEYTPELEEMLKQVYDNNCLTKTVFKFYVPLLDLESVKRDAPAYTLSEEVIRDIKYSYSEIKALKTDNYAGTNSTGTYGTKNDALKTFVSISDNIRKENISLPPEKQIVPPVGIYLDDINPFAEESLGENIKFSDTNTISQNPVSKALYNKVLTYCEITGLKYSFKDYTNLNSELAIFANALNELCGMQPFAIKEDGTAALTMEEIHHFDYSCKGYMVPTVAQYSESKNKNPKNFKNMEKNSGKNFDKYLYLMK